MTFSIPGIKIFDNQTQTNVILHQPRVQERYFRNLRATLVTHEKNGRRRVYCTIFASGIGRVSCCNWAEDDEIHKVVPVAMADKEHEGNGESIVQRQVHITPGSEAMWGDQHGFYSCNIDELRLMREQAEQQEALRQEALRQEALRQEALRTPPQVPQVQQVPQAPRTNRHRSRTIRLINERNRGDRNRRWKNTLRQAVWSLNHGRTLGRELAINIVCWYNVSRNQRLLSYMRPFIRQIIIQLIRIYRIPRVVIEEQFLVPPHVLREIR